MDNNARQRPSQLGRPLSIRAIVIGGVLMGAVGAVAVAALLYFYGDGTPQDQAGLDVVRTAGTLIVGTGGAIALLLTARRQRSTELTLQHQREVAATTAQDAVEQRITELYTRAVDQLGNDQALVRLGLHALERLAQNNPPQRQTIVDVICAYLRIPYTPPDDTPPGEDATAEQHSRYEQRRQELQVRMTAQRILTAHLGFDAGETFWSDIDLDLSEARLHRLDLSECRIRDASFEGARFSGDAKFGKTPSYVSYAAVYAAAQGDDGDDGDAIGAQFSGWASFVEARFSRGVRFEEARFDLGVSFEGARFSGYASFDQTRFRGYAKFNGAVAQLSNDSTFDWAPNWTTRHAREGEEEGWLYLVEIDDSTEW